MIAKKNTFMSQTFLITGATGFIGSYLVKALLADGHKLVCLVRNQAAASKLQHQNIRVVLGDICDIASLRQAMEGVTGVFHLAAIWQLGVRDKSQMHQVNVEGSKNVFAVARELKIPKIIYCSTVAALGNTASSIADETWPHDGQFQSEYCRTKYLAHQIAKEEILKGTPIVIVMPSVVYGIGDTSALYESWRQYCQGKMPFVVAPNTRYTYVHVEDVVRGMILAYESGKIGESYILAGQILSNQEALDLLEKLTKKKMPKVELPLAALRIIAVFDEFFSALRSKVPFVSKESIQMMENCNWAATSAKAQQELGWQFRPIETGFQEIFAEFINKN